MPKEGGICSCIKVNSSLKVSYFVTLGHAHEEGKKKPGIPTLVKEAVVRIYDSGIYKA